MNTGKRNGTEIVQVYVRKANDTDGLIKTLKGFQRIGVSAGKARITAVNKPVYNQLIDRYYNAMP